MKLRLAALFGLVFVFGVFAGYGLFVVTSYYGFSFSRLILGDRALSRDEISEIRCEKLSNILFDEGRFEEISLKDDFKYAYDVTVHDYDGDGLPDIISTDAESRTVHIFLNRDNQFEEYVIRAENVELMERNALGDVTGDGKPNFVVVDNRLGTVVWFDGENPRFVAPAGTLPRAYDVALADFNNDGHLDIAASSYKGNEFRIFFNPGSNIEDYWPSAVLDTNGSDTRTVRVADFDGDGDPDILGTARRSNMITWFENTPGIWRRHTIDSTTPLPNHGQPVDLDQDGDTDVVMAAGYHATERQPRLDRCTHGIFWYENINGGSRWERHVIRVPFVRAFEAAAGDLDGDGDIDVAATAFGAEGRIAWFENPGDPKGAWRMRVLRDDWIGGTAITIADIDGDAMPEILSTASHPLYDLHIWKNRIESSSD